MSPAARQTTDAIPRLRRLQLTMGLQCNVRCSMCYQTDYSPRFNMPAVLYRDRLREVYPRLEKLKIIGGEPTIMRNCRDVAEIVRQHPAVKLDIHTNGVRIDEFWHETFLHQGGEVFVSLNAAREASYDAIVQHGSFRAVRTNIERLVAARRGAAPKISVSTVILKENALELAEFLELGRALGVDAVGFIMDPLLSRAGMPAHAAMREQLRRAREIQAAGGIAVAGLDHYERAFCPPGDGEPTLWPSQAKVIGRCAMPFYNLEIGSDGAVRVCCNSWVKLGNLYDSSLDEIWGGARATAFREKMDAGDYLWCSPHCEDNPKPHRLSLAHKAVTQLADDPRRIVRKIGRKVRQL